jgi:hypothetical protein
LNTLYREVYCCCRCHGVVQATLHLKGIPGVTTLLTYFYSLRLSKGLQSISHGPPVTFTAKMIRCNTHETKVIYITAPIYYPRPGCPSLVGLVAGLTWTYSCRCDRKMWLRYSTIETGSAWGLGNKSVLGGPKAIRLLLCYRFNF